MDLPVSAAEVCLRQLQDAGVKISPGSEPDLVDIIQTHIDAAHNQEHRMQVHNLKTWPASFLPIWNGDKRHEFRKNDRNYQKGDELVLSEWDNKSERFTGRVLKVKVTHIDYGPSWGIPGEYCVMSLAEPYERKGP